MSTRLIEELEEAADSAEGEADILEAENPQGPTMAPQCRAFAARLRERVEHVRRMLGAAEELHSMGKMSGGQFDTLRALTGPLPREPGPR